jgi:hypothetical protein
MCCNKIVRKICWLISFALLIPLNCSQKSKSPSPVNQSTKSISQINKGSEPTKANFSSIIPGEISEKYFSLISQKPPCPTSNISNYITIDYSSDFHENLKGIFLKNKDILFPFSNPNLTESGLPDYISAGYKILCDYLPLCYYISFDESYSKIVIDIYVNYKVPDNFEDAHELAQQNSNSPVFLSLASAYWFILPTYVNLNKLSFNPDVQNAVGGNSLIESTKFRVTYRKSNDEFLRVIYNYNGFGDGTPYRNDELIVHVKGYPTQEVIKLHDKLPLGPAQSIDGKITQHGLLLKFFETDRSNKSQ